MYKHLMTTTAALATAVFILGGSPALADFTQPSAACPGAFDLISGEPDDPGPTRRVLVSSGTTASCVTDPGVDVSATGSGITFTNFVTASQLFLGIAGSSNHVVNNGDLSVVIEGDGNDVTNSASGSLSGNIFGNDTSVANDGDIAFMTIEGDRARVANSQMAGISQDSGAIGFLVIGADAEVTNHGAGAIVVNGTDSIAVGLLSDGAEIVNSGLIQAAGTEATAAGIEGNDAEITNSNRLDATGTEATAAFVEGDDGTITNTGMVNAAGDESSGMFIEGDHGTITNSGELRLEGDLASGMAVDGIDATLTNNVLIETRGDVTVGIGALGNGATVANNGRIEADGENAFGMGAFGTGATIENEENAVINTNGAGAHGVFLGLDDAEALVGSLIPPSAAAPAQGTITNDGDVTTFGVADAPAGGMAEPEGADGIHAFANDTIITNNGEITTLGRNSNAIAGTGDDISVNQAGAVETRNANSDAIKVTGAGATVNNTGGITTLADRSAGVSVEGSGAVIEIGEGGMVDDTATITTSGEKSHGIALGRQSTEGQGPRSSGDVKNFGRISTEGNEADGIHSFANDGMIENRNAIATTGDRAAAINHFGDRVDIGNPGTLTTEGQDAPGIRARGQNLTIVNGADEGAGAGASISTLGDGAHGILVAPESGSETNPDFFVPSRADITNITSIETAGEKAHGILAAIDDSTVENTGSIKAVGKDSRGISTRGAMVDINNSGTIEAGSTDMVMDDGMMEGEVTPEGSVGINFTDETAVENSDEGNILVFGENSVGVRGRDGHNSVVGNDGRIGVLGDNTRGVDVEGDNVRVENVRFDQADESFVDASIAVEGEGAIGIRTVGQGAFVSNRVTSTEAGENTDGISVIGDNAVGIDVTATGSGAFLVENAGNMRIDGANAIGMALRNETANSIAFSSENAESGCAGAAKGAGLLNCGGLTVNGDDSTGLVAEGLNDSTIDNFGTINVTGDRATAIKLDDGAQGAGADNNFILNLADATATGIEAKGVSIKGDGNILVQGNDAVVLPVDANTFSTISQQVDAMIATAEGGMASEEQVFPLGDIRASGTGAVGVAIEGDNNVVGVTLGFSNFDPTGETPGLPTVPKIPSVIAEGAGSIGIQLSGDNNTLSNFGIISGGGKAIEGGAGKETVIAAGAFVGAIDLAGGDDEFNLAGGMDDELFVGNAVTRISGTIDGGDGIDVFRLIDSNFFGGGSASGIESLPPELFQFGTVDGDRVLNFEDFIVDITDASADLSNALAVDTATIEEGTLRLDSAGLEAERITIREGGFLTGNGTITALPNDIGGINLSQIVVESGGGVLPGDSPGTLEFIGDTVLAGLFEFEIAGLNDGEFDRILIDGGLGIQEGEFLFSFIDDFVPEVGDFVDFLTVSGDITGFDSLNVAFSGLPSGFDFDVSFASLSGGGFGFTLDTIGVGGATTVPEPSTLALLGLGLAGLAGLRWRKRTSPRVRW